MEHELEPPSPTALSVSVVVFYTFFSLLGLGLLALQGLDASAVIFGDGAALARDALAGAVSGLTIVGLTRFAARYEAVRKLSQELAAMLGTPGSGVIALLAVTSAVGEELLFRGALQPLIGFLPTAILFGLLHGGFNARFRLWAAFALAAGLILGALTLWTGNLLAAILCHLTVNYFNLHTVIHGDGSDSAWG
ncbi:MAG: CPBP family intramembrane metalloprotease [Myxococcota bacterium]|jgi:membrane protease YdiL (CAAX protease family)|nr:CPBP family intramembrane metalloprotease [Myxococcota bacterium]